MAYTEHSLQNHSDKLQIYRQADYRAKLIPKGARPLFTTKVFKSSENDEFESCPLKKKVRLPGFELIEELGKLAPYGHNTCIWMSDTLAIDLNVPVTTDIPYRQYPSTQILLLAEGRELFILTVCDVGQAGEENTVLIQGKLRKYSLQLAKLLTSALYNFCHCDFVILPCALVLAGNLSVQALEEEIGKQKAAVRLFYGGPETVSKDTYSQLRSAITAAAYVSYFPCFLRQPEGPEVWLLLLDPGWRDLLSLVIEAICHKGTEQHLTFTSATEFKVMVVVLEAAARLSLKHTVIIIAKDEKISSTVKRFIAETEKEDMQEPKLTVISPTALAPPANYVINIDNSCVFFHCTLFRFLLVGKTGSGKSATGNTVLGEQAFGEYFSFKQGTAQCEMKSSTQDDVKVEIMDTPGLCETSSYTADQAVEMYADIFNMDGGVDAVLYVVQIDRYTEEDLKVFLRTKAVLGDQVVKHMIIVFTFGDKLSLQRKNITETTRKAPWMLREVLVDCGFRFVVFNNKENADRAQVKRLMEMVKKVKERTQNIQYDIPLFTEEELQSRLDESLERFTQMKRKVRSRPGR